MDEAIKKRVIEVSNYIFEHKCTVREAAKYFKMSKTTVHDDVHKRLKYIDKDLFDKIQIIFNFHFKMKHINGGIATKIKYLKGDKK